MRRSNGMPRVAPLRKRGVTLIEVMAGVAVFALVVTGSIQMMTQFQRYSRHVSERIMAHSYAREIVEQIKNAPDFATVAYGGQINSNLTLPASADATLVYQGAPIHTVLNKVDTEGNTERVRFGVTIAQDPTYSTLKIVTVRIEWKDGLGKTQTYSLRTAVCRGFMQF